MLPAHHLSGPSPAVPSNAFDRLLPSMADPIDQTAEEAHVIRFASASARKCEDDHFFREVVCSTAKCIRGVSGQEAAMSVFVAV